MKKCEDEQYVMIYVRSGKRFFVNGAIQTNQ